MTSDPHLHLRVAVERDGEPIRGTLHDGDCTTIPFAGWLELMSAFDTVRARPTNGKTNPPPGSQEETGRRASA